MRKRLLQRFVLPTFVAVLAVLAMMPMGASAATASSHEGAHRSKKRTNTSEPRSSEVFVL